MLIDTPENIHENTHIYTYVITNARSIATDGQAPPFSISMHMFY